jgi:hypothetical protein
MIGEEHEMWTTEQSAEFPETLEALVEHVRG